MQKGEKMSDRYGYIAIETLLNFCENSKDHAVTPNDFMRMSRVQIPSAQPEIIRCKDCKNWERQVVSINDGLGYCSFHEASFVSCDGYCYWAERREDG